VLIRLDIQGVRNLRQVNLAELAQVNVFYGANGSGKTSVLESIHLLSMARSFRGNSVKSLITHGEQQCVVYGNTRHDSVRKASVGVQRRLDGDVQLKINGAAARAVSELVEILPTQVINASSFSLLTGAPASRRQYLDWGVFHVEHDFLGQWQRFQRCIKQRNKLLRHGKIAESQLSVWTRELCETGEALNLHRKSYFALLSERFRLLSGDLLPGVDKLELRYRQGWEKSLSLREALDRGLKSDLEQGYTHAGPQRADIRVYSEGYLAADMLSRGQQKLVICALKIAQGQLLEELAGKRCAYLVDDLPSELDEEHNRLVCAQLAAMKSQVFITSVDANQVSSFWPDRSKIAMFHVEHGKVTREYSVKPG
jgi:DNA replication and repair protein RecF